MATLFFETYVRMPPKHKLPPCGFLVTVKPTDQSVPIKVKKVAKGKRVSVLSGITGSRAKAVETLKQMLGVGGEISADVADGIELQGDQSERLTVVLRNLGALQGETVTAAAPVRANYSYDKFMKKDPDKAAADTTPAPGPMSDACVLVHGRYWPYCNGDCSFCPPLTDVFEGLNMYCSWWEDPNARPVSAPKAVEEMSREELDGALSALGLKAEVGEACRLYEKEKNIRIIRSAAGSVAIPATVPVPVQPPVMVRPRPRPRPDRPVRVILNRPQYDDYEDIFYVMEVSLVDPSLWMSDYEDFVGSLITEASIDTASKELIDSRTLKILFSEKRSMDKSETLLHEVMPNFLKIQTRDAVHVDDASVPKDVPVAADAGIWSDDMYKFQEIAEQLGLESNPVFWEFFTTFCDQCDGSNTGLLDAFEKAVLEATTTPPLDISDMPDYTMESGLPPPPSGGFF